MKTRIDGITRRRFLGSAALAAGAGRASAAGRDSKLRFGFTTYQWGTDWDIPTLIANCTKAKAFGVELRTTAKYKHVVAACGQGFPTAVGVTQASIGDRALRLRRSV